jgi:putative transposase
MPRSARIVVPGIPHHLTQRGNNRQDVFFVDNDRQTYLRILAEQCARHGTRILGYCLMDNHIHLIAIPRAVDSLAKSIGRTHWRYAQYINRLHRRSGHLWQNRFYSNAMDDAHCLLAMRYIERNPLRADVARIARNYQWSSAAAHCGDKDTAGLLDAAEWKKWTAGLDWEQQLSIDIPATQMSRLRRSWHTGRPLATDGFLSKLERRLGQRLRPLPIGRPRKSKKNRRGDMKK